MPSAKRFCGFVDAGLFPVEVSQAPAVEISLVVFENFSLLLVRSVVTTLARLVVELGNSVFLLVVVVGVVLVAVVVVVVAVVVVDAVVVVGAGVVVVIGVVTVVVEVVVAGVVITVVVVVGLVVVVVGAVA